ncbi:hypothetical protein G6F43_006829 [Rhizopus delemar]|nr:hypothetical protein G6F43_006829 [Rhizopus delemar]
MNNSKLFEAEDPANDSGNDTDSEKPARRSGRRKIKIEYIEDKNRRHITFSKRKAGIMKKAYELSTLTGTQVLLLVVSETGLVYTFTTVKLQPIVTKPEGKNLIQACLNAPDPNEPSTSGDASYANTSPQVNDKAKFEDTKVESKQELAQPTNTRYAAAPTATGYASSQYGTSTNNTNNHLPYNYPAYQQSSQQQPSQYGMQQPFYGNQQPHYMPPQQQPSQQQQQPGYWQQQQQPSQQNTANPPGLAKQEDEKSRMN